jgi:putative aldouronate transport system permease protein
MTSRMDVSATMNADLDRGSARAHSQSRFSRLRKACWRDRYLFLLILPVVVYYIVFHYIPMYGAVIAFKDYAPGRGILDSPWVGFENFEKFFGSFYFVRIVKNTILLSLYTLLWGFPIPILFAVLLNELRRPLFKRSVQTISYLPHFISVVVVSGMIVKFLSPTDGVVNRLLGVLGIDSINFLSKPEYFRSIFVASEIWQGFGWGAIIYLAALAGIDPSLYEAADVDGAKRWQKIWYITLPSLVPVMVFLLVLNVGNLMSVGFEKVLLLYSPATYETSDVIQTYIYRRGIISADYSLAAAIGLFNSTIDLILLVTVNRVARKMTETSLW